MCRITPIYRSAIGPRPTRAASFDAATGPLSRAGSLGWSGTALTIAILHRPSALTSNSTELCTKRGVDAQTGYEFFTRCRMADSQFILSTDGTGATLTIVTTSPPTVDAWNLLLCRWTGSVMQISNSLYQSALTLPTGSTAFTGPPFRNTSSPLGIGGATTPDPFALYAGTIAQVVGWDASISDADLSRFYNGGRPPRIQQFTGDLASSLMFWYDLDEYSGGIAATERRDKGPKAFHLSDPYHVPSTQSVPA